MFFFIYCLNKKCQRPIVDIVNRVNSFKTPQVYTKDTMISIASQTKINVVFQFFLKNRFYWLNDNIKQSFITTKEYNLLVLLSSLKNLFQKRYHLFQATFFRLPPPSPIQLQVSKVNFFIYFFPNININDSLRKCNSKTFFAIFNLFFAYVNET
jgi:hypothetical protein